MPCWIPLLVIAFGTVHAVTMEAVEIFSGSNCAGTPDVLAIYNVTMGCAENACSNIDFGNDTYYISRTCNVTDRFAHTEQVFGDFTYVIMETYDNESCTSFGEADTFLASGSCEISSGFGDQSAITSLFPNGSAVVVLYPNNACGGEPSLYFELDSTALSTGSCQQDLYRFYSSESNPASITNSKENGSDGNVTDSSGTIDRQVESSMIGSEDGSNGSAMGTGVIVGIVAAGLVFVLIVSLLVAHHLRKKHEGEMEEEDNFNEYGSPRNDQKNSSLTAPGTIDSHLDEGQRGSQKPLSLVGLWDDEVIATARIPREKVVILRHICRGGGGERYDDKADMFSFGVLLSELDVHVRPYSHAKENGKAPVADAVILQKVALGTLQVEFSSSSLESMVDLGLACVSLDPTKRPSSAEALYRLHTVLSQEL
ncbi:hypothetical protein PPTG_22815 [Phytophthora nicotianae INRA-310]|uniref:Protein kinase domain-containing protein n=1 Tax=Phytophthora nicotianae (strain INRA-310) TaxID=761204 RepID=W2Q900_PHYN3|nr:hypothetical protein PPTG_22815 [Phytophthora nicotianae INRA-310]ETN09653.1 hypothetical protein PPTG_22815 [Phytophthora nicotianae INRA-310]